MEITRQNVVRGKVSMIIMDIPKPNGEEGEVTQVVSRIQFSVDANGVDILTQIGDTMTFDLDVIKPTKEVSEEVSEDVVENETSIENETSKED